MVNVNVIGRLGTDAEILEGKNGQFVSFRLAVSDFNEGERTTSWFRVTAFDERTKKLSPYLKKGSLVNVIGTESVRIYKDRNGEAQVGRDIKLNNLDFISTGSSTDKEPHATDAPVETPVKVEKKTAAIQDPPLPKATETPDTGDGDDDLPF